jgi:1-acyl-sn-glycerol-3-phosphate acyltransferase
MKKERLWLQNILKPIFRCIFRALARVRVMGLENLPPRPPYIIFSNHISWFDPPLVGAFVPRRHRVYIMAMEGLFAFPPLGMLMRLVGGFPVSRGSLDRRAIEDATAILENGGVVLIFPEGGIGRLHKGEKPSGGISLIAERTNVPLVPLGISGCRGLYRFWKLPISRPWITIRVGKPFLVSSLSHLPGKRMRQATMERIKKEMCALAGEEALLSR